MKIRSLASLALAGALLSGSAHATEAAPLQIDEALVIVNSGSVQTQGMAMVLANTIQARGTQVEVLLCDRAGDLALKGVRNPPLKPRDVTPELLLQKLQQGGASVNVCALYLPNSEHDKHDLRDGVGIAAPPAIATKMTAATTRVYSF